MCTAYYLLMTGYSKRWAVPTVHTSGAYPIRVDGAQALATALPTTTLPCNLINALLAM